ncbi:hypothetical protein PLICRDRAFT_30317 [Plicaturopsis crispa FD-325 SS-3]|nr:hypothetical protein PLICRDRAFT_30317 [Plicaturopsis crispa FD-325 SS-3]
MDGREGETGRMEGVAETDRRAGTRHSSGGVCANRWCARGYERVHGRGSSSARAGVADTLQHSWEGRRTATRGPHFDKSARGGKRVWRRSVARRKPVRGELKRDRCDWANKEETRMELRVRQAGQTESGHCDKLKGERVSGMRTTKVGGGKDVTVDGTGMHEVRIMSRLRCGGRVSTIDGTTGLKVELSSSSWCAKGPVHSQLTPKAKKKCTHWKPGLDGHDGELLSSSLGSSVGCTRVTRSGVATRGRWLVERVQGRIDELLTRTRPNGDKDATTEGARLREGQDRTGTQGYGAYGLTTGRAGVLYSTTKDLEYHGRDNRQNEDVRPRRGMRWITKTVSGAYERESGLVFKKRLPGTNETRRAHTRAVCRARGSRERTLWKRVLATGGENWCH